MKSGSKPEMVTVPIEYLRQLQDDSRRWTALNRRYSIPRKGMRNVFVLSCNFGPCCHSTVRLSDVPIMGYPYEITQCTNCNIDFCYRHRVGVTRHPCWDQKGTPFLCWRCDGSDPRDRKKWRLQYR